MSFLFLRSVLLQSQQRNIITVPRIKNKYKSAISIPLSTCGAWNDHKLKLNPVYAHSRHINGISSEVVSGQIVDDDSVEVLVKSFQEFNLDQSSREEIAWMQKTLKLKMTKLNYDELVDLVKALSGDGWCNIFKQDVILPDTFAHQTAREMLKDIRKECNLRLKRKNVEQERFISLSNENFLKVLEFCHHWVAVEKSKSRNSFTWSVVNKIGDQETRTSMRRFKHFTKDGFVSYCNLMREVNLYKDFHKYYCIVKFVDLFPQMTEDDIGQVCNTFHHHNLTLPADHPMCQILKTKLVDYLI